MRRSKSNQRFRDARSDFNGRANKRETERMAVSAALLTGMLLMTPWVLKSFGFYGDSATGLGFWDCAFFGGLLLMAAALGWVAFGEELAARSGKGRGREDERHGR
ncbi:MAG: hypothetical protein LBS53_10425 [Synergistaceae bacterium]|jgi:hypothetical protein|nr:hypothetical protein [Synergistaceae bacterium]